MKRSGRGGQQAGKGPNGTVRSFSQMRSNSRERSNGQPTTSLAGGASRPRTHSYSEDVASLQGHLINSNANNTLNNSLDNFSDIDVNNNNNQRDIRQENERAYSRCDQYT